jgi:hypothetical protein
MLIPAVVFFVVLPAMTYGVYRFERWSTRCMLARAERLAYAEAAEREHVAAIRTVLDSTRRVASARNRAIGAARSQRARTLETLRRARYARPVSVRPVPRVAGYGART